LGVCSASDRRWLCVFYDAHTATDQVTTIAIPDTFYVMAVYPIAVLKGSAHQAEAQRFVLSADGQAILTHFGFLTPH
jgi:ABC-type Fe3+ transport system substrate-binding protein